MAGHQLQRLHSAHYRLVDLALQGFNQKELAEKMGMTTMAISLITGSPVFQAELSRRRQDLEKRADQADVSKLVQARSYLEGKSLDAAHKLGDLLGSDDERVALMSAKEILDRADQLAPENSHRANINLEPGAVQLLVLAIQESKGRIVAGQSATIEE